MSDNITLQKALYTIRKLKHLLQPQPVAIVGIGCRFPEANGKEEFWRLLSEGCNIISHIPEERWQLLKNTPEVALRDPNHPYWGGFLSDVADFDPYFFGISPREALRMDPQQRLLLEVTYEAIEDAGLSVETLAGSKTGVFCSLYGSELAHLQTVDTDLDALYLPTGNPINMAANRISYLFDLHGPSIAIDSACSSSLAAIHLAYLNLQNQACDLAIVGGVKLNLLPYVNLVLAKAKMLSPDGQCKTFDAGANGYVQGEGAGVIVLKPLKQALQDKDRIYAIIANTGINQDGKTNGLTAPNGLQQEALLKSVYQHANINPLELSYIECHGTGTFLGDPIEIEALGEVVGKKRSSETPCWIGSVKTNVGHLEPAAGMASIIKVALSLKHAQIPPHLNFTTPNPHILFDKYHLRVPQKLIEWPRYGMYRLAGVSGFGFGGTNSHIALREVTEQENVHVAHTAIDYAKPELFTLAAKDQKALTILIDHWRHYLEQDVSLDLGQLCYNNHLRRSHYPYRIAIIAHSIMELHNALSDLKHSNTVFLNTHKEPFNNVLTLEKQVANAIATHDLKALATLYVSGAHIDWRIVESTRSYPHCDMPLYPWQHKKYWPPLGYQGQLQPLSHIHPLQGQYIPSPLSYQQFTFKFDIKNVPELQDTYNVAHAGYYLEMLGFAVQQLQADLTFTVEDFIFESPLIVANTISITVQVVLKKLAEKTYRFIVYSNTQGQKNWIEHAHGKLALQAETSQRPETIATIQQRCANHQNGSALYDKLTQMKLPTGETIRWTHEFWLGSNEIVCAFNEPKAAIKNSTRFALKIHPGVIDACVQPLMMLLPDHLLKPYVAASIKNLRFFGLKKGPFYLFATLTAPANKTMMANLTLSNANQEVVFECHDICMKQLDNKIQIEDILQTNAQFEIDLSPQIPLSKRKEQIQQFLIAQIATIFSMPPRDIDVNKSLRDLGMDSLMALVLIKAIEITVSVTYSLQDLLEGPTVVQLVDSIINHIQQADVKDAITLQSITTNTPWISYRQPQENPQLRLFCLPYGGAGASVYREWQQEFPTAIEVCPIQLPAREERIYEPPIKKLDELIDTLITQLQPEWDRPFALFGHSFGSLVAFELTRALRKRHLPHPNHLFVSAFPDPRLPTKSLDKLIAQAASIGINLFDLQESTAIASLSDQQLNQLSVIFNENSLIEYGEILLSKEIIKVLLPTFIGDMSIVKNYQYYFEAPLELPITVFAGKQDKWIAYEELLGWKDHTRNKCEFYELDSGHLFIREAKFRKDVLHKILTSLEPQSEHSLITNI